MSWLTGKASSRDELLDLRPELAADHRAVLVGLWDGSVDPIVLELCRLRTATLLGASLALAERTPQATAAGLTEDKISLLSQWPRHDAFTNSERACLGFAEQFVLDVHGITPDQTAAVLDAVGPRGVITLTTALALWELTHRFDNALGANTGSNAGETD